MAERTPFSWEKTPFQRQDKPLGTYKIGGYSTVYTATPQGGKHVPTGPGFQKQATERFIKTTDEGRRAQSQYGGILAQGGGQSLGYQFQLGATDVYRPQTSAEREERAKNTKWYQRGDLDPDVYSHTDYRVHYYMNPVESARLAEMESETRMLFTNSFFS